MGSSVRSRRLVRSIFGGALGRAVGLVTPFVVMPQFLDYLGTVSFGVWATATGLTSMAAFLDFGIGNELLTRLAFAFGRDDRDAIRRNMASGYLATAVVALVMLAIGGLAFVAAPSLVPSLDRIDPIVGATMFGFVVGIPLSLIHRLFYARQEVWKSSLWQIFGAVLAIVSCFAGIRLQLPPAQIVLFYACAPVVAAVVATVREFARDPELRPRLVDVRLDDACLLAAGGLRFFSLAIVTSVALNADNVIIAHNAGLEAVTNFNIPAKLGSLLMLLVTTLFLPLWAANGEAIAKGDYAWVRHNTRRMSLYGAVGVALVGGLLVALADPIIWLWTGRQFPDQQLVLAAFTLYGVAVSLTSPAMMVLNSLGRTRIQIVAWLVFAAVSIPVKMIWVADVDLWRAPLVTACAYFVVMPATLQIAVSRFLSKRGRENEKSASGGERSHSGEP